jgi:CheY-like chemotaxis protein
MSTTRPPPPRRWRRWRRTRVEVAVIDLMMPGINGLELARQIGRLHPGIRVMLASAYHLSARQFERADCGACAFIPKPYSLPDLCRALRAPSPSVPPPDRDRDVRPPSDRLPPRVSLERRCAGAVSAAPLRCELLDYVLPEELIARRPTAARDGRGSSWSTPEATAGAPAAHRKPLDLPELLPSGALLVVNDTRVVPARLLGKKTGTGGRRGAAPRAAASRGGRRRRPGHDGRERLAARRPALLRDGARLEAAARGRRGGVRRRRAHRDDRGTRRGEGGLFASRSARATATCRRRSSARSRAAAAVHAARRRRGGSRALPDGLRARPRRDRGADGGAAPVAAAPRSPRGARRRARVGDAARGARHVSAGDRRRSRRAPDAREPFVGAGGDGPTRSPGPRQRGAPSSRSGRPWCARWRARRIPRGRATCARGGGRDAAPDPAGVRVPRRRSAAHELPPPALDAARARLRLRRDASASGAPTQRRSPRATASIRTETPCCFEARA